MVGGLPRDLIRAFRNLFEERGQRSRGSITLAILCSALIESDLKLKMRSAAIEIRDAVVEPEVDHLLRNLSEVESWLESPEHIRATIRT